VAIVTRKNKSGPVHWVVLRVDGKSTWRKAGSGKVMAEAKALESKWKGQLKAGTYDKAEALPEMPTVAEYGAHWLRKRSNRRARDDARLFRLHVEPQSISSERLTDVRPRHALELVEQLRAKGLADKTISNVVAVLHTMFRDAILGERAYTQPMVLPKEMLKRRRKKEPEIYQPGECLALMRNERIPAPVRVLWAILFCTGVRQGEGVGLRWKAAQEALGMNALHIREQYDGAPLKTDTSRVVPVHPELAPVLTWWATEGWLLWVGRRPGPDDFLVPAETGVPLTKDASYKALRRSCEAIGVPWHGVHGTRHTFISLCKRGGADHRNLRTITHNPLGDIVDGYTRQDWEPLCAVVRCLSFDQDLRISLPSGNHGKNPFIKNASVPLVLAGLPENTKAEPGLAPDASATKSAAPVTRSNIRSNSDRRRLTIGAFALGYVARSMPRLGLPRGDWVGRAEAAVASLEAA